MFLLLNLQDRWKYAPKPHHLLVSGDIVLSQPRRAVFVNDTQLSLTKKEFDILQMLMSESGNAVTHTKLLKKIWGIEYGEADVNVLWRTVDRLRGKLLKEAPKKRYIQAVRGVGYAFMP